MLHAVTSMWWRRWRIHDGVVIEGLTMDYLWGVEIGVCGE